MVGENRRVLQNVDNFNHHRQFQYTKMLWNIMLNAPLFRQHPYVCSAIGENKPALKPFPSLMAVLTKSGESLQVGYDYHLGNTLPLVYDQRCLSFQMIHWWSAKCLWNDDMQWLLAGWWFQPLWKKY